MQIKCSHTTLYTSPEDTPEMSLPRHLTQGYNPMLDGSFGTEIHPGEAWDQAQLSPVNEDAGKTSFTDFGTEISLDDSSVNADTATALGPSGHPKSGGSGMRT